MSRLYRLRLTAVDELDEHAAFLGTSSPTTAVRFLQAAEQTFEFLAKHPGSGANAQFAAPRAAAIRVWRIKEFPNHLVLYQQAGVLVEILRVVHAKSNWISLYDDPA